MPGFRLVNLNTREKIIIMKKVYLLLLVLLALSAGLSAKETPVTGSWLLTKVEEKGKTEEVYAQIVFKDDGYAEWEGRVFGKWVRNKKTFTIESEMIKEIAAEWKISTLNNDEFILTKPGSKLYFIKFDKSKIEAANKNSGLEGTWKVTEIVNAGNDEVVEEAVEEVVEEAVEEAVEEPTEEVVEEGAVESGAEEWEDTESDIEKTLIFSLPNNLKILEVFDGGTSTSSGTWMYNELDKTLIVVTRDENLRGKSKVVKLTGEELVIENKRGFLVAAKVEQKNIKIERLKFTESDFYDENGDYKYGDDVEKLPWEDYYLVLESLKNIKQLTYDFSTLVDEDAGAFDTKTLTANVVVNMDEETIEFDDIFKGTDRASVSDDEEMPVSEFSPDNSLFPFEDNSFRVAGQEEITTPAGTFKCTTVETTGHFDEVIKLWMINDKPGVIAKVILDEPGHFGHYKVFELTEIK